MAIEADLLDPEPAVPVWTVYDRMKKAREEAGITSHEAMAKALARRLAIAVKGSTVGAWERGTNQPTKLVRWDAVLEAWALVTHVPLLWLAHGEGSKSRCFSESAQVSEVPPMLGEMHLFDPDAPETVPFVPVLVGSDA